MDLSSFDFHLPEDRIALRPAEPQDEARLLIVRAGGRVEDAFVRDLPDLLNPGDITVFNDTRVLPAALQGVRPARDADGRNVDVSINLLEEHRPGEWSALARPSRRLARGDRVEIADGFSFTVLEKRAGGEILITFETSSVPLSAALERHGAMPLPPYIARRRPADHSDRATYQTSYARGEARSVAAPTAGLHFTESLRRRMGAAGIVPADVRLHVGGGTFRPLSDEAMDSNRLHQEWRCLTSEVADEVNVARRAGHRCVAIGTTAMRTLESCVDPDGQLVPATGPTDLFIKPGDPIRVTDALVTNFHLPRSSLFMLVCALMGTAVMQAAYAHAIENGYRFYSYGDACLLLPEG